MSTPPDRMAVRPAGDPTKIMGVKKPIFWGIVVFGVILALYIWRRGKSNPSVVNTDPEAGLTAADIGGTPGDNSFATTTDQTAIEEQIKSLQDALFQLQQSNGGNGAGITGIDPNNPGGGISPAGSDFTGDIVGINPGPVSLPPSSIFNPGGSLPSSSGIFNPGGSLPSSTLFTPYVPRGGAAVAS